MAFLRMAAHLHARVRELPDLFDLPKSVAKDAETEVDKRFRAHEKKLFATEGAHGGTRWTELSEPYRTRKQKTHPGRKILTREGEMRDAFSKKGGDHISESFRVSKEWTIRVGAQSQKGFWHATGAGNLPVRAPIQATTSQREQIALGVNTALVPHVTRFLKTWGRVAAAQ